MVAFFHMNGSDPGRMDYLTLATYFAFFFFSALLVLFVIERRRSKDE